MRVKLPFIGDTAQSRVTAANSQVSINLYPKLEKPQSRNVIGLYSTPGLLYLFSAGLGPCRSQGVEFKGNLYFVSGNNLIKITSNLVATQVGTLNTTSGRCGIAAGRDYLMIVDGTNGYYFDGTTFTQIVDADFPVADYVCWLDGYFIVNSHGTDKWHISAIDNPATWAALDFAQAEARPDFIRRVDVLDGKVWAFGDLTTQAFWESGNAAFPFDPILPNGVFEWGLLAVDSLAKNENAFMFLAKNERGDAVVLMISGLQAQVISDRDLEWQINNLATLTDAQGFFYRQAGETFYVLTFPSGGVTHVYDFATGLWHQRQSQGLRRWRPAGYGIIGSTHIVGDYLSNKFYELDFDTHTDNGEVITRLRRGPVFSDKNNRIFFNRLEILFEAGVGLITGQGSNPQAMLRWSDDGGYTWSNERWTAIGAIGQRRWRAVWNQLGGSFARVFEVSVSDPVPITIMDAYADIEVDGEE